MKYNMSVNITKNFEMDFPDALFTDEHMENVQTYSISARDMTPDELKQRIAEYYALYGQGYAEQYGCYIGMWREYDLEEDIFVHVREIDEDVETNYIYSV